MGLFANITHLLDTTVEAAADTVVTATRTYDMALVSKNRISKTGPQPLLAAAATLAQQVYLVVPPVGRWTTLIETAFIPSGVPSTVDLAEALSSKLNTTALALVIHDDDILLYNLFDCGQDLDGYNSCPQYFENERLSEDYIASQRHSPQPFAAFTPPGVSLDQLTKLLNRGWWDAHDRGALDEDGVQLDDDDFVFESDRIIELGNLLEINGPEGEYPFAFWSGSNEIPWSDVIALTFSGRW